MRMGGPICAEMFPSFLAVLSRVSPAEQDLEQATWTSCCCSHCRPADAEAWGMM